MTERKYRNNPTTVDNITFDSAMESRRYAELKLLQRAGEIQNLRCQVRYELIPAVKLKGAKRLTPGIDYVADFIYTEKGRVVIEDCKGALTAVYKMKRHMMKALLDLDIFETKPRK